jgi:hypothetical protein
MSIFISNNSCRPRKKSISRRWNGFLINLKNKHCAWTLLKILFLSIPTINIYATCVDKNIVVANNYDHQVEIYNLGNLDRPITTTDIKWQSPVISNIWTEVKRVTYMGQDAILAATGSGAIIYSYPEKKLLFHREITGYQPGTHSVEPLPNGSVVLADAKGYLGILFPDGKNVDQPSNQTKWYPLTYVHGVVWDDKRHVLYALGYLDLMAYQFDGTGKDTVLIPTTDYAMDAYYLRCAQYNQCNEDYAWADGGHDLHPLAENTLDGALFLTTGERAFIFYPKDNVPYEPLSKDMARIPIKLTTYSPLYAINSNYSIKEEPNADKDKIILKKGGIKSISGSTDPNDYCVVAHSAPWFTTNLFYSAWTDVLLYVQSDSDRPDHDITANLKILFDPALHIDFYKARFFGKLENKFQ